MKNMKGKAVMEEDEEADADDGDLDDDDLDADDTEVAGESAY